MGRGPARRARAHLRLRPGRRSKWVGHTQELGIVGLALRLRPYGGGSHQPCMGQRRHALLGRGSNARSWLHRSKMPVTSFCAWATRATIGDVDDEELAVRWLRVSTSSSAAPRRHCAAGPSPARPRCGLNTGRRSGRLSGSRRAAFGQTADGHAGRRDDARGVVAAGPAVRLAGPPRDVSGSGALSAWRQAADLQAGVAGRGDVLALGLKLGSGVSAPARSPRGVRGDQQRIISGPDRGGRGRPTLAQRWSQRSHPPSTPWHSPVRASRTGTRALGHSAHHSASDLGPPAVTVQGSWMGPSTAIAWRSPAARNAATAASSSP